MTRRFEAHDVTAARIVERPHWASLREVHDVPALVGSGVLTLAQVEQADRFLVFLTTKDAPEITVELFLEWGRGRALFYFDLLRAAFRVLFEPGPAHRRLDQARVVMAENGKGPKKPYPQRKRQYSVYPQELPPEWQAALSDMEEGLPGARYSAPAPSMTMTIRTKVCELAKVMRDEELALELTIEALRAYEASLHRREKSLNPRTILSAMRQLRDFGRYIGASDEIEGYLAGRLRRLESKVNRTEPLKEAKVYALPTYAEILEKSFDLLGEADRTEDPVKAQQCRNFGVAIALFCPFPLRLADTNLRFGREILWDGYRYSFNICTSKTSEVFRPTILPVFAFFIDQLVLQGSHPDHLDALRAECLNSRRPLFVSHMDDALHAGFVSYAWRQVLRTGCHAARTKLHDELAELGQEGVELAMRACTQRSEKTAEFYRTRAYDLAMIKRVHDRTIQGISKEEWAGYFD